MKTLIRIKEWEEMEKEYGQTMVRIPTKIHITSFERVINIPTKPFTYSMKKDLSGKTFMVDLNVNPLIIEGHHVTKEMYSIVRDSISNEAFDKLMLTGRVAKCRNGKKYLIAREVEHSWLGLQKWALVREDGFMPSSSYEGSFIKGALSSGYDIVEILQFESNNNNLLNHLFLDIESKKYVVWSEKELMKQEVIIEARHFGNPKVYQWKNTSNLDLEVGDVVEVETSRGNQLVEVINILNFPQEEPTRKVVRKIYGRKENE